MRRLLPLAAVAVAAGLVIAAALSPPAVAKRADRCFAAAGRTVDQTPRIRLFTRGADAQRLYGCRRRARPQLLVRGFDDGYVSSLEFKAPVVAGRFAAYGLVSTDISCKAACPPDYEATRRTLMLVDLRTGEETSAGGWEGEPFALTATGAVAWVADPAEGERAVLAHVGGEVRSLAQGAGLGPGSVEASRSRVTWLRDGRVEGTRVP